MVYTKRFRRGYYTPESRRRRRRPTPPTHHPLETCRRERPRQHRFIQHTHTQQRGQCTLVTVSATPTLVYSENASIFFIQEEKGDGWLVQEKKRRGGALFLQGEIFFNCITQPSSDVTTWLFFVLFPRQQCCRTLRDNREREELGRIPRRVSFFFFHVKSQSDIGKRKSFCV